MQIDPKTAEARLKSESNLANRFRSEGKPKDELEVRPIAEIRRGDEVPEPIKNTAAVLANSGVRQIDIAEAFDVPQPSVSGYKNGRHGVDKDELEKRLEPVRSRALDRLMESLNLLSNEKMEKLTAVQLSLVAANMGKVVDKTIPKEAGNYTPVNLILYSPELRSEKKYKTIEV